MDIHVNGQPYQAPQDCTLSGLVEQLGLQGKRLAIEVNGTIVTRSAHLTHALAPGDRVEIVQAIGGG
ncbi:MAG: sulfur carrier protein ThiS [Pseudomonadota bacterium]|nr:sulfur carrier protein ThiS [Pseudomonadota bacterium]